jgi:hypothetical protein
METQTGIKPICGEDVGTCIHCYEYKNRRLCSIALSTCEEGDEDECLYFIRRKEE